MVHLVTAVVRPHAVEAIKETLQAEGHSGLTVTEARGYGRQGGHSETYRGAEYKVDFIPKARIECLVDTAEAERVAELIAEAARSGKIGDGKIWITAADRVIRIRTGERDAEAV